MENQPESKKAKFDDDEDFDMYGDVIGEIEEGEINEAAEEIRVLLISNLFISNSLLNIPHYFH